MAIAALNLAAGAWISLQPSRLTDLQQIVDWTRQWIAGVDPYAATRVDYPPWALVLLAPLGAVPDRWGAPVWVAINVALAIAIAEMLARLTTAPRDTRVRLAALVLAAAAFRTLNQFSLLAFAAALAGASVPSRLAGGLLLGVGLIKPQIGGPVLLWVLATGHPRRALASLIVPIVGTLVFAWHAGLSSMALAVEYTHAVRAVYGHDIPFTGHTDLKGLVVAFWPAMPGGLWFSAAVAIVLLLPAAVAFGRRGAPLEQTPELLAFFGVVSLIATRHLSYDLVLVAALLVVWASDRNPLVFPLVFVWLILDPGAIARRLSIVVDAPFLLHVDRVFALVLWGALSMSLLRRHAATR